MRNRIRRRIKEAARLTMPAIAKPAHDYVLIGRSAAETRGFEDLRKDIISAVTKLHAGQGKLFAGTQQGPATVMNQSPFGQQNKGPDSKNFLLAMVLSMRSFLAGSFSMAAR